MLESLTYDEYIQWVAFYNVEPFAEERADLRTAILIASFVKVMGGKAEPKDFMLDFWGTKEDKKQTTEEILSKLKTITNLFGEKGKEA